MDLLFLFWGKFGLFEWIVINCDGIFLGAAEILPMVEADLKKIAARIIGTAKEYCHSKSVFIYF